jgi:hypothetical protein
MLLFVFLGFIFGVLGADDPLRPQYHLMPVQNWLNDPNGPVYYNGYYHMFFQHNPNAAVWGDMHWVRQSNIFFLIIFFSSTGSLL